MAACCAVSGADNRRGKEGWEGETYVLEPDAPEQARERAHVVRLGDEYLE